MAAARTIHLLVVALDDDASGIAAARSDTVAALATGLAAAINAETMLPVAAEVNEENAAQRDRAIAAQGRGRQR